MRFVEFAPLQCHTLVQTRAPGRFTFLKEPIHPAAVANCRECRRDEQHRLTLKLSMAAYARCWNRADPHCPTSDDATLRCSFIFYSRMPEMIVATALSQCIFTPHFTRVLVHAALAPGEGGITDILLPL